MAGIRSQLRATPITVRWVALALVLVGGTAATVAWLSYARARDALVVTAETRLELLGRDVALALYRKLMDHAADITTWARLETMVALTFDDVDKELATLLDQTIGTDTDYVALAAFDRDGRRIATAGDTARLPPHVPAPAPGATQLTVEGGTGLLRFVTPVANPQHQTERIGTLIALVDPGRLLRGVAADRVQADGASVTLTAAGTPLATAGPPARGSTEAMLTDREPVPVLRGVEAPALSIDVHQPARLALASVDALRRTLIRIALGVVVLSGIAGALFAWRLSVPIRRLTAAVKGITARGRPEPIGEPVAGGEVGVLTEAFNTMMERLALAEREAVAQSRLALLGEVAASIVHDVRTPLSVLKTSAQLLAGAGELSAAERRDLAALVASEVDRLNRVVTHLADLGRPRPTLRARRSVAELVERTVSVLRPWARARGVAIETQGDAATSIVADTDQVLQALLNLVHNAVQASPAGGRVTIRWEPTPAGAAIDVTDTGPGFTAEALERACAPFFTTKADGTGLGLAIVKRIVEAHDGTVTVRNVPGTGAGVRLELPSAAA